MARSTIFTASSTVHLPERDIVLSNWDGEQDSRRDVMESDK